MHHANAHLPWSHWYPGRHVRFLVHLSGVPRVQDQAYLACVDLYDLSCVVLDFLCVVLCVLGSFRPFLDQGARNHNFIVTKDSTFW